MRPILLTLVGLSLAGLAACSSHADKPPGPDGGPGRGMGMGRIPTSPAGELLGRPVREEADYGAALTGWFQRVDTDKDGALSAAEVAADTAIFFALLDKDGDRGVNARELADYRLTAANPPRPDGPPPDAMPPDNGATPRRQGPEGGPPPGNGPGGGAGGMGGGLAEDKVMAADRNLDFRVSLDELTRAAQERVAAMDTDKDGRVTLEEVQAAAAKAFNEKPARGGPGGRRGPGGGGPGGGPDGGGRRPPN